MKKIILLLLLIISFILLTGCWNRREINTLAIASAVGIDKSATGYTVSAQLINSGEIAAEKTSTRSVVTTYKTEAETMFEAFRKLTLDVPRKIYFAHLKLIIFGEDLAKEGIIKTLDFFIRDHEMRLSINVMIAKNTTAEELLKVLTPVEKIPANKVFLALEMSQKVWASTFNVQLGDLVSGILSDGKNPVLTGVIIKGDPKQGADIKNIEKIKPPAILEISTLGVLKDDKLVGWLNEKESIGYNFIIGELKSTVVTVACPKGGKLGIEIIRTKVKTSAKVIDNKPKINIELLVEGNINDVECKIDLSKPDNITLIDKKLSEEIKKVMEETIKTTQEYKSDILGFGEEIHRTDYKVWNKLKTSWDKNYEDLQVEIKVIAKIRNIGTISKPILE